MSRGTAGIVSHFMDTGAGYSDLHKLASKMSLGSNMTSHRYYTYHDVICTETKNTSERFEVMAAEGVSSYYENELKIKRSDDGVLDVDVSYDGSWLTRGHKSKMSAGFVVEADTGIILDHECLSKHCHKCDKIKHKYKNDEALLAEKMQGHIDSGKCSKNYEGTSGGMEKDMALRMWNRSEDKNAMRYSTMVSDGDSSTYLAICENVDYPVEKLECVNHVSKRLGTRLRNLKKTFLSEIKTATGRIIKRSVLGGRGKLTDAIIDELGRYFGKAIRDCADTTADQMRKTCLSGIKHVTSTDENPDHEYCPTGENSWCFYNRAIAKEEQPPSHDTMKVSLSLNSDEKAKVVEVYESLTTDELMGRCLKGRTQNANESLHSKLWMKKPKNKFYGLASLKQAASSTTMEHNFGFEASNIVGNMPFAKQSEAQRDADSFRENTRRRKSLMVKRSKKRKRTDDRDEDYGAGEH